MLTLLIIANGEQENLTDNHLEKIKKISKWVSDVEIVFLVKSDFKQIKELEYITINVQKHYAMIANPQTTEEEMIKMGMEFASGNDVLLCTLDTLPEVLSKVLEKQTEERKIVWVRKKALKINGWFQSIGIWAYNLGLSMLGKNNDNFSETHIQYIDGRIANSLAFSESNSRELRMTYSFKQVRSGVVEENQIYQKENPNSQKERAMIGLGFTSFLYILAFLSLAIIYPCFNNMTYSWWMIIILVAWVTFGIVGIIVTSKKIYQARCGTPPRMDEEGNPLYTVLGILQFGDKLPYPAINKVIIKSPTIIKKALNPFLPIESKAENTTQKGKKPLESKAEKTTRKSEKLPAKKGSKKQLKKTKATSKASK